MVPGLPIIGLGRNPAVAWGGTNLRAASSDLFDVSRLPPAAFAESEAVIRQRLWFGARRRVRTTPLGPVVTDAAPVPSRDGEPLALRWAGHEPTDEITALLRAARAPRTRLPSARASRASAFRRRTCSTPTAPGRSAA